MSTLNSVEWGGCVYCAIITLMNILVKGKEEKGGEERKRRTEEKKRSAKI